MAAKIHYGTNAWIRQTWKTNVLEKCDVTHSRWSTHVCLAVVLFYSTQTWHTHKLLKPLLFEKWRCVNTVEVRGSSCIISWNEIIALKVFPWAIPGSCSHSSTRRTNCSCCRRGSFTGTVHRPSSSRCKKRLVYDGCGNASKTGSAWNRLCNCVLAAVRGVALLCCEVWCPFRFHTDSAHIYLIYCHET